MRVEEVQRANRELSAYFKGRRTEREARAALKILKAFVRERESLDYGSRPPLPGASAPKPEKKPTNRRAKSAKSAGGERPLSRRRRKHQVTIEPQTSSQSPGSGAAPANE